MKTAVALTGRELNAYFNIKDRSNFNHQQDLVSYGEYSSGSWNGNYIGESGRRISDRIMGHNGRDLKSDTPKHSIESGCKNRSLNDFNILVKNFKNYTWKQNIAGSLSFTEIESTLKVNIPEII